MDESKETPRNGLETGTDEAGPPQKPKDNQAEKVRKDVSKSFDKKIKKASFNPKKSEGSKQQAKAEEEVDLDEYNLGGGIKYKLPSKRLRMTLSFTLFGLNALLVLAVLLYFKVPGFHDFIINVGR